MTELKDLSPEQRKVVESWGKGLAVLAGAGSGKTTTLVIKCSELLKRNPEAKFAAVSFTERSASDLKEKLSKHEVLGNDSISRGHWVMTIHGLCAAVIGEYPREAGFDGEESMLSESESQLLWEKALELIWSDDLPEVTQKALDLLLERETRDSVFELLKRVRDLQTFGALEALQRMKDASSQALASLSAFALDRYDRLKRRRGVLDFNDLERGADQALLHEKVSEAYRGRFDLFLVDEFQDTNPVQARIISRFARADLSNLCVVGDPKQSIYRFRDADVAVFEDFCRRLPETHSLTWNFRSRPPIIEFANDACRDLFAASGMNYEALIPKREAVSHACIERLDVVEPKDLAQWLRAENQTGVGFHEMALLLRKIRGNESWLKALNAAGIPIAIGSGGFFWEDPRVREMVAFLKWWDQPGNTLSGAVFLRAPWVGFSDEEIDHWVKEYPTFAKPFFRSRSLISDSLRELQEKILSPAEILSGLLVSQEVEDEIGAPYLGLWHRLEEMSSRGLDFHQVVLELDSAIRENRRERDVPPPKTLGQISVLTLHSSKGLEFPRVILLDFAGEKRASNAPLLFWDKNDGVYFAERDSDGDRDPKSALETRWRESEKSKDLAESKRLFYVAITRAQEKLLLVCPPDKKVATKKLDDKKVADPEAVLKQDNWRAWIERVKIPGAVQSLGNADTPRPVEIPPVYAPDLKVTEMVKVYRPRHSVTEWNVLSKCPRAYEWQFLRPPELSNAHVPRPDSYYRETSFDDGEVSQRELGNRVHAALERGDAELLQALENEVGIHRLNAKVIANWMQESPLMRTSGQVFSELPFEIPMFESGEIIVGSIDRFVKNAGNAYLIDFKVTEKDKAPDQLIAAYHTQMELYAWALSCLDPSLQASDMSAYLVHIFPSGVREIRVPLQGLQVSLLAQESTNILNGGKAIPKPSKHCLVCDFKNICDARLRE